MLSSRLCHNICSKAVGSTEITQALDPEENLEVMGGAIRLLSAPIEEHGGRIVRIMGDGLLAVFGISLAHENDPDRAVHSALQMLAIAREYAAELKGSWGIPDYQVRLGISTGLVAGVVSLWLPETSSLLSDIIC